MSSKIRLHIIGGLGDVSLTRKYPVLYQTLLLKSFEIVSISDIYSSKDVKNNLESVISTIVETRLKGKLEPNLKVILTNAMGNSIAYHQLDRETPKLQDEFFGVVQKGDVIDVSVPNSLHLSLAKQVLARGGNLLVEKPLCSSLEEAIGFEVYIERLDLNGRVVTDAEHYSHYGNIKMFRDNFARYQHDRHGGFGLGKIKEINLAIEENEDFKSARNQEIIEIKKSGGGIWLDTGIHALSFLKIFGAVIDPSTIEAQPFKSAESEIQDAKYGETRMQASFDVFYNEYISPGCHVQISVGKSFKEKKKLFTVTHEHGKIELDITKKSLVVHDESDSNIFSASFPRDAFYYVFDDLRKCIVHNEQPLTPIKAALQNVKDVFIVYKMAKPLRRIE